MTITVETTGGMIVTGDTYADVVEKVEALGITIKGPANPLLREMPISDPRIQGGVRNWHGIVPYHMLG